MCENNWVRIIARVTRAHRRIMVELRGRVLVEKLFCSFFNPVISLYIYYDQYEKILRNKFPLLVFLKMAAIFDFRALDKIL